MNPLPEEQAGTVQRSRRPRQLTVTRLIDWRELRDLRLKALADAPSAFGATLERELALPQDEWIRRCETSIWSVARISGESVGLACLGRDPSDDHSCRRVFAMWVRPSARGTSAASSMLQFLLGWASAEGARKVLLHVAADNLRAIDLYQRHGFQPTGRKERLAGGGSQAAIEMQLSLPDGPAP